MMVMVNVKKEKTKPAKGSQVLPTPVQKYVKDPAIFSKKYNMKCVCKNTQCICSAKCHGNSL